MVCVGSVDPKDAAVLFGKALPARCESPTVSLVERLVRTLRLVLASPWSVAGLVAVGVLLRGLRYAANRSLWGDEGALALNIVGKSTSELLEPLDFLQGAPTGYLLTEKAAVALLGNGEPALRLFALLCGVASVALFAFVARRLLEPVGATLALAVFAVGEPLVYYSSEVKQYSTDVAAALVLLVGAVVVNWGTARAWLLGVVVIAAGTIVWFSHTALIVLPALALALVTARFVAEDQRGARATGAVAVLAGTSAAASYFVNRDNARRVGDAALSAEPASSSVPARLAEPARSLWEAFADPVGLARTTTGLALIAALIGLVVLARRSLTSCLLVATPIAATLAASFLDLYPFSSRFVLFLVPFFALLLGAGLAALLEPGNRWQATTAGILAVALMLGYPVATAARNLASPPGHEELKDVLEGVQAGWRSGDALYVWYQTQYPFRYYAECSDCGVLGRRGPAEVVWPPDPADLPDDYALASNPPRLFVGRRDHTPSAYASDLARLRGRGRIWLLFSSTWDDAFVRYTLDCMGTRLQEFRAARAVAYLYDLRPVESTGDCLRTGGDPAVP